MDGDEVASSDEIWDGVEVEEVDWHALNGQDTVANTKLLTARHQVRRTRQSTDVQSRDVCFLLSVITVPIRAADVMNINIDAAVTTGVLGATTEEDAQGH